MIPKLKNCAIWYQKFAKKWLMGLCFVYFNPYKYQLGLSLDESFQNSVARFVHLLHGMF